MKEIKAYVRREKVDMILQKLEESGVKGMTVIDVFALGDWADEKSFSYSIEYVEKYSKVVKLEIICDDSDTNKFFDIIAKFGITGQHGDGMIFISNIEKSLRIRTGELNKL